MSKLYAVGGLKLELPIIVGAGVCKVPEQILEYQEAPVGAVTAGSFTLKPRDKNLGSNMWPETVRSEADLAYVINSWGMPNCGVEDARAHFKTLASSLQRPLILSFAGFSSEDYRKGYEQVCHIESAQVFECNLGCPNTAEHGGGITMSYDIDGLRDILVYLNVAYRRTGPKVWLKFSPFHHPAHDHLLEEIATLINAYFPMISAVVAINTLPNVSIQYGGKTLIEASGGYGGLSGMMLKPIALQNVRRWRAALRPEIDVIGMGGAVNGDDIVDFLREGAAAVGLTSLPCLFGGAKAFQDVLIDSDRLEDYLS